MSFDNIEITLKFKMFMNENTNFDILYKYISITFSDK